MKTLGERIKNAREEKGMLQSQLAKAIGVRSGGVVSNWEQDINKPDADKIVKICKALDVSVSYLLDYYGKTSFELSVSERKLIEKYRNLDDYGRETIDWLVDREAGRIEQLSLHQEPTPVFIEIFPVRRYLQSVSAGFGEFNDDSSYEMLDLVKRPPVGTSFVVTVNGDSMEPTYKDGDLLFVKAQEAVSIGDIGLFVKARHLYIKEMGRDGLISHNKDGNYPIIRPEIDAPIITQGKVIGVCTPDYLQ